jgi:hypothetical protein
VLGLRGDLRAANGDVPLDQPPLIEPRGMPIACDQDRRTAEQFASLAAAERVLPLAAPMRSEVPLRHQRECVDALRRRQAVQ